MVRGGVDKSPAAFPGVQRGRKLGVLIDALGGAVGWGSGIGRGNRLVHEEGEFEPFCRLVVVVHLHADVGKVCRKGSLLGRYGVCVVIELRYLPVKGG